MKYNLFLFLFVTLSSVLAKQPDAMVTEKVILDMEIEREKIGQIEIGLFRTIVPKTVENFVQLCKKPAGEGYQYNEVYSITNYGIKAGHISKWDGSRGESIYGEQFFRENYKLKHNGAGWVSMVASSDKYVNTSFFISLNQSKEVESLNGLFVVFGKVLKGMDVVKMIASIKTSGYNSPLHHIVIINCTVEDVEKPFIVEKTDAVE